MNFWLAEDDMNSNDVPPSVLIENEQQQQQQQQEEIDPNYDPIVDIITNHDSSQQPLEYELCEKMYIGYEINSEMQLSIDASLRIISEQEIDYVVNDLAYRKKQETQQDASVLLLDDRPMAERHNIESTELLFRTTDWSNSVVGRIDVNAFEALGSEDFQLIKKARTVIETEMAWAFHLSVPAVVLPCPTEANIVQYANILMKNCNQFCAFWIRVPVDKWYIWNELRILCSESNLNLIPFVELKFFSPSDGHQQKTSTAQRSLFWQKWFGENLKVFSLPLNTMEQRKETKWPSFTTSGINCYIAEFVKRSFRHELQIVLTGSPCGRYGEGLRAYIDCLERLYGRCEKLTEIEAFEKPYRDFLQSPLQPLHHNLESQTYEVFERDPVKYALYQEAIHQVLIEKFADHETVVLMVVGAGRGPLVKAAIRAFRQCNRSNFTIYAVEKNPNALVSLYHFKKTIWNHLNVHIIQSDMRVWEPEQKADILVSELLGSFGDNELSPECLDGAQRLLKPDTGVSIPCSYRSYLSPLMSSRIHQEVKAITPTKVNEAMETAYVINVFNGVPLSEPKLCFSFEHPNYKEHPIDNTRYTHIDFTCPDCCSSDRNEFIIHGLIGYFECTLYGNVLMSILPSSFSKGMFSWFPIVFPLKTPISVKGGSHVQVHMYRCVDKSKVWYEWMLRDLTSHQTTVMHNVNGRSYSIGL